MAPLILSHHERWDGTGYPAGLKEEEIPLGARILSVADYFDGLTVEQPYARAVNAEAAIAMLQEEAGKGLDPKVVETFLEVWPSLQPQAKAIDDSALGRPPGGCSTTSHSARETSALYPPSQTMGTSLGI